MLRRRRPPSATNAVSPREAVAVHGQPSIPRWRGFNLPNLAWGHRSARYDEQDFAWMAGWGFDFARLPLSYWLWSSPKHWRRIDEAAFAPVDQAIAWGAAYGIHVSLSFHRLPGYCVNNAARERHLLFGEAARSRARALEAAERHWRFVARRYRDVPSDRLSFDLLNEPPFLSDDGPYVEIIGRLACAIRQESPHRVIVVNGADLGQRPVPALTELGVVHSTRGYLPKMVSHYQANWVPPGEFESTALPEWPMTDARGTHWDRDRLRFEVVAPWATVAARGAPVHVGEWGCHNTTPHEVALAWMADLLALWQQEGWGWAMWNLRGAFGVVDSERADVAYESFDGHLLDRDMLELLQAR